MSETASEKRVRLRTRMAELQKEYSALNVELKDMQADAEAAANREKYKEYLFKIGTYAYEITEEAKIEDATDEDRESAGVGASGMVYTGFDNRSAWGYILLKDKSDYSRAKRVLGVLWAAEKLKDEKAKDKEHYVKVLLGEEEPRMKEPQQCDSSSD